MNDTFKQFDIIGDWNYIDMKCPIQKNCHDCGVCMCTNIEYLTRGEEPNYRGNETGYFRKKIAVELFQGKLFN